MTSTSQAKLVSEPWHDAGDGVLAVVGDLGVPDGLVLALEDDLAALICLTSRAEWSSLCSAWRLGLARGW